MSERDDIETRRADTIRRARAAPFVSGGLTLDPGQLALSRIAELELRLIALEEQFNAHIETIKRDER